MTVIEIIEIIEAVTRCTAAAGVKPLRHCANGTCRIRYAMVSSAGDSAGGQSRGSIWETS